MGGASTIGASNYGEETRRYTIEEARRKRSTIKPWQRSRSGRLRSGGSFEQIDEERSRSLEFGRSLDIGRGLSNGAVVAPEAVATNQDRKERWRFGRKSGEGRASVDDEAEDWEGKNHVPMRDLGGISVSRDWKVDVEYNPTAFGASKIG